MKDVQRNEAGGGLVPVARAAQNLSGRLYSILTNQSITGCPNTPRRMVRAERPSCLNILNHST